MKYAVVFVTASNSKEAKKIKAIHSYTVPEIIFLPIIDGNSDYLKWIKKETK